MLRHKCRLSSRDEDFRVKTAMSRKFAAIAASLALAGLLSACATATP